MFWSRLTTRACGRESDLSSLFKHRQILLNTSKIAVLEPVDDSCLWKRVGLKFSLYTGKFCLNTSKIAVLEPVDDSCLWKENGT